MDKADAMTKMNVLLMERVLEGQRENIVDAVVEKILYSHDYEEYIEEQIENVLSNLTYVGKLKEQEEDPDGNYFKDNLIKLVESMTKRGELSIELRLRAIEQVLFKTSSEDRNRLFDHIYEKIENAEKRMMIENERLEKLLRRFEKRAEMINV